MFVFKISCILLRILLSLDDRFHITPLVIFLIPDIPNLSLRDSSFIRPYMSSFCLTNMDTVLSFLILLPMYSLLELKSSPDWNISFIIFSLLPSVSISQCCCLIIERLWPKPFKAVETETSSLSVIIRLLF